MNFEDPRYYTAKDFIRRFSENLGHNLDNLKYGIIKNKCGELEYGESEEDLSKFLNEKAKDEGWDKYTIQEWISLIENIKEIKEKEEVDRIKEKNTRIVKSKDANNGIKISDCGKKSAYIQYKQKLKKEKGFTEKNIENMDQSVEAIANQLVIKNSEKGRLIIKKGLVMGNIQSGKTANITGLMALAADNNINMFIILSGMIENLRMQTQKRIENDLKSRKGFTWKGFEKQESRGKLQEKLSIGEDERVFTVCLKNKKRLENLIKWLREDEDVYKGLRIMVIDDESDQASVNTGDIKKAEERKTINKLICNLVNNKKDNGEDFEVKPEFINYISYTATPYANILNESGEETLYPKDFIFSLPVSKSYFGPQQIFGGYIDDAYEKRYSGLDIVRNVNEYDLDLINKIYSENSSEIPDSLEDAICWFLCVVSVMKLKNKKGSFSMLIHTDMKTVKHEQIKNIVINWFRNEEDSILDKCKRVWEKETKTFTLNKLKESYFDYEFIEEVEDYPYFSEFEKYLRKYIEKNISFIEIEKNENQNEEIVYTDGIHLCVDNSSNNKVNEDGEYLRLIYPSKSEDTKAFIVIGGNTLSRGLTLEGLVSSYFVRNSNQSDTLMQMGRWFGYRKGYEIYPRIWMTENTLMKFEFLKELDSELRQEFKNMTSTGLRPSEYGPMVKNTMTFNGCLRITSKNKMQSAEEAEYSFAGKLIETTLFYDDKTIGENNINTKNIKVTEEFLNNLKSDPIEENSLSKHGKGNLIWSNIEFSEIKKFLTGYEFHERLNIYRQKDALIEWFEKMGEKDMLKNWNVIVSGLKKNKRDNKENTWKLNKGNVYKIQRSRIKRSEEEGLIRISKLLDPADTASDIRIDKINNKDHLKKLDEIDNHNFNKRKVYELKKELNMSDIPQLIIYRIDKNSKEKTSTIHVSLNSEEDLIGIAINIPGEAYNRSGVIKLSLIPKYDNEW